jgi:hypothetical protein
MSIAAGFVLLLVRGLLLWLLVPLALLVWVLGWPWWRHQGVSIGAFLGWLDLNLIALLQRTLLRPLFRATRRPWVPVSEAHEVDHRIAFLDPA